MSRARRLARQLVVQAMFPKLPFACPQGKDKLQALHRILPDFVAEQTSFAILSLSWGSIRSLAAQFRAIRKTRH
jgi:uncharacterized membrane protein